MWKRPQRIESNTSRKYRYAVCFAASMGWITVIQPDGRDYGRSWHLTAEGELALRHHERSKL